VIDAFLLGMFVGVFLFCFFAWKLLSSVVSREEKKINTLVETLKEKSLGIPSKVEEINGVFYIYSTDKNEFLAQGNTAQEILEHLNFRMPNAHIRVIDGEPDVVKRLKATISAS